MESRQKFGKGAVPRLEIPTTSWLRGESELLRHWTLVPEGEQLLMSQVCAYCWLRF